jgi:hypothetical protein
MPQAVTGDDAAASPAGHKGAGVSPRDGVMAGLDPAIHALVDFRSVSRS